MAGFSYACSPMKRGLQAVSCAHVRCVRGWKVPDKVLGPLPTEQNVIIACLSMNGRGNKPLININYRYNYKVAFSHCIFTINPIVIITAYLNTNATLVYCSCAFYLIVILFLPLLLWGPISVLSCACSLPFVIIIISSLYLTS